MKTPQILLPILFTVMNLSACTGHEKSPVAKNSPAQPALTKNTIPRIITSAGEFGITLFKKLLAEYTDRNVLISPYAAHVALGMTYQGSSGSTESGMRKALSLGPGPQRQFSLAHDKIMKRLADSPELLSANSVWFKQSLRVVPAYRDLIRRDYSAEAYSVAFGAPGTLNRINRWISDHTKAMVKKMITRLHPMTEAILISAVFFKGQWQFVFDPEKTRMDTFTKNNLLKKRVPFMYMQTRLSYYRGDGFRAVKLDYRDRHYSMLVLLPDRDAGIRQITAGLSLPRIKEILGKMHTWKVRLYLPRFKSTFGTVDLKEQLKQMGMAEAFGSGADFSKMALPKGLFISKVLSKAAIEVNEKGTRAAAAVAVVMTRNGGSHRIHTFRADHPFLYLIMDNRSGLILFLGTYQGE